MSTTATLIELAKTRRTYYMLGNRRIVPFSKIEELVNNAILHIPSSFNTQSCRLVVLIHEDHTRLWDLAIDIFGEQVRSGRMSKDQWENRTRPKLERLKAAYGTILFYEDPAHIISMSEKLAKYKNFLCPWAEQSSAMHQWFLWVGLESLGFGANLQHFNPIIDTSVAEQWKIPTEWRLIAQLVFGSIEGPVAAKKDFKSIKDRVVFYGNQ